MTKIGEKTLHVFILSDLFLFITLFVHLYLRQRLLAAKHNQAMAHSIGGSTIFWRGTERSERALRGSGLTGE